MLTSCFATPNKALSRFALVIRQSSNGLQRFFKSSGLSPLAHLTCSADLPPSGRQKDSRIEGEGGAWRRNLPMGGSPNQGL